MIRFRSYRTRLLAAFLLLGLGALGITVWQATEGAGDALRTATYDRLTAIRETKGRQIERYFVDLGNHVLALSSDEATVSATEQFLATAVGGAKDPQALFAQYEAMFRDLQSREPDFRRTLKEWFPDDPVALTLQHWFITRNPHDAGSRFRMLSAPDGGAYSDVHARYHPTFYRYLSAFGFYDIFLIHPVSGRILYSVMKEVDLGTELADPPYSRTTLAAAWRRAVSLSEPETFVIEDYAPYFPSSLAPAAFVAAPVYRAGTKIGVLAIQLSIVEINRIMTGDGQWAEEGLGRTGQAYLIGSDGTLRSDVRHEIEDPAQFQEELQAAGASAGVIDRVRRYRTAVLNLRVAPGPANERTAATRDFRGVEVLRSEAPLSIGGLDWRVVAEIETAEALSAVDDLRWRMLWLTILLALALGISAHYLAGHVTRPILRLAAGVRRLARRDFSIRLPVESADEVGQLAASFNQMAGDLEQTTVSRQELDRMLASLINAVFVIDTRPDAGIDDLLASHVRQGNRAWTELLHRDPSGLPFRALIPDEHLTEWRERIHRVLAEGRLPAVEVTLCAQDGTRVPVLFAASWLAQEDGSRPGLVCVAQDISEWKATQDSLRRMSKVFMDATDPMVIADAAGRIVDCNSEAGQTYGWSRSEIEGRHLEVLFTSRETFHDALRRCLSGEAIRNMGTVQVDRNGREFPALVTLSLLLGENGAATGVAAISKDITERELAEQAIRQKQKELEALTGRLITAQEEERTRLARELHDDLTQRLAAIAIEAGRLERVPGQDARWQSALDHIKKQMAQLSTEVHGLARRLHPSTLDDLGLVAAIESECRAFFERTGIPVDFSPDADLPRVPKEMKLGLYRIVQEALRNALKHARADEVRIDLRPDGDKVMLAIADNGAGFDRSAPGWRAGVGLASMEERTRLLGGSFSLRSAPGEGTRIEVRVPLGDANEKARNSAGGRP